MWKSAKARAAEQLSGAQKKDKEAVRAKEKAWNEMTERVARQRARRLAREADDRNAADKAVSKKAAATNG